MESSIISLGRVKSGSYDFRIDAEFFKQKYVELDNLLLNTSPCDLYLDYLTDGTHQTPEYLEEGIPFLSSGNVDSFFINFQTSRFISNEANIKLDHCQPGFGNILVSKSGRIGHAAIVPEPFKKGDFNIYEGLALLKIKNFDPYALTLVLNSKIVQDQIKRSQKGVAQPHLHLEDIRNLRIPNLSIELQRLLRDIYTSALDKYTEARKLLSQVEKLIENELNFHHSDLNNEMVFFAKSSVVFKSERLDSDYFNPRYQNILSKINSYKNGSDTVGNLFKQVKSNFKPTEGTKYKYIEIGDVDVDTTEVSFSELDSFDLPANAKTGINEKCLLISKVRPNRGAVAVLYDISKNLVVSGAFTTLCEDKSVRLEVLQIYLRSTYLKTLLMRSNTGTSYPVVRDLDILNLPIPLFDKQFQNQIYEHVTRANQMRLEARESLRNATESIEVFLKEGNEMAIRTLKLQ